MKKLYIKKYLFQGMLMNKCIVEIFAGVIAILANFISTSIQRLIDLQS